MKQVYETLTEPFVNLYYWFSWKKKMFKHYYKWIKRIGSIKFYSGYDMFKLINYQLTDTKYSMENGYIDWTESPENLKSIQIAIKLSKRLGEDFHGNASYDRYEKLWPTTDKDSSDILEWLKRDRPPKQDKDLKEMYESEQRQYKRDARNLLNIIEKYHQGWLD